MQFMTGFNMKNIYIYIYTYVGGMQLWYSYDMFLVRRRLKSFALFNRIARGDV
jgi:hypothetical protein